MPNVNKDANNFEPALASKSYRRDFLTAFEQGWGSMSDQRMKPVVVGEKLIRLLELLKEGLDKIEQDKSKIESLGAGFGILVGVFRFTNGSFAGFANFEYCSSTIVKILWHVKGDKKYIPYYEILKKIINEWHAEK